MGIRRSRKVILLKEILEMALVSAVTYPHRGMWPITSSTSIHALSRLRAKGKPHLRFIEMYRTPYKPRLVCITRVALIILLLACFVFIKHLYLTLDLYGIVYKYYSDPYAHSNLYMSNLTRLRRSLEVYPQETCNMTITRLSTNPLVPIEEPFLNFQTVSFVSFRSRGPKRET